MKKTLLTGLAVGMMMLGMTGVASAGLLFDQNVTPVKETTDSTNGDLLMGTGIENGGFTVDTSGGVELGLRGRLRFDSNNEPTMTFNSNGHGTYSFEAGHPTAGLLALWNYDWSINISTAPISSFSFVIGLDIDPTAGTNYFTYNPLYPGNDSATTGTSAQNSWNYGFLQGATGFAFNPDIDGTYNIYLEAFSKETLALVSKTDIQILVGGGAAPVPEPATMLLFGTGLAGLAAAGRRKKAC